MRAPEKTALLASLVAAFAVTVLGAALSVAVESFARGFVLLGAISLIAASIVLWRPFASRLLEEGIRSAKLVGAVDVAYRAWKKGRKRATWGGLIAILLGALIGLVSAVFIGFMHGPERSILSSPISVAPAVPAAKPAYAPSVRRHGRALPLGHSSRNETPGYASESYPEGQGKTSYAEERDELEWEEPEDQGETSYAEGWDEPEEWGETYAEAPGDSSVGAAPASPGAGTSPRTEASKPRVHPEDASLAEASNKSPLIPILIAVVVLAAISIGAFQYRQRRLGGHSPAADSRR